MGCEDCTRLGGEVAELKAAIKMNELKIKALLELIVKEGVMSRDDFEALLGKLCEGDGA